MMTTNGTTVINLNVLDTSSTNDLMAEIITLAEVANALFPSTNATQTLTVDSSFWSGDLQLTFAGSGGRYFTIGAVSLDHFTITQTDQFGSMVIGSTSPFYATTAAGFLSGATSLSSSGLSNPSGLATAKIVGDSGRDVIQGIANNTAITNILQGGAGADVLTGGSGQNLYVYTSASDSPFAGQLNSGGQLAQTWDQITNFHRGVDRLDFTQLAGVSSFVWLDQRPVNTISLGAAGAHGIWYTTDGAGGSFVYVDTTGDGTADLKIQVLGVATLSVSDFRVPAGDTAPVVTDVAGTTPWVEASGTGSNTPVVVDSGLTVSDVDNATLASATVSISNGFVSGEDVLAFTNNPATMGNIAGSYNASTGLLTLTSAGSTATLAQSQSPLR